VKAFNFTTKIQMPRVPNFLLTEEGMTIPVSAFGNDMLRQIGEAWTTQLLNNAERQRIEERGKAEAKRHDE
jgi:hypothetical protein